MRTGILIACVFFGACSEQPPQNAPEIVSANIQRASLGPASEHSDRPRVTRPDTAARNLCLSNELGGDGEVWVRFRSACEIACREGNVYACGRLASSVEAGLGGPKDLSRAKELFGKVCASRKAPHACFRSGLLLRDSGEKDRARAAWDKGCKLGASEACDALKGTFTKLEKKSLYLPGPPPKPSHDHDHGDSHDHDHGHAH